MDQYSGYLEKYFVRRTMMKTTDSDVLNWSDHLDNLASNPDNGLHYCDFVVKYYGEVINY